MEVKYITKFVHLGTMNDALSTEQIILEEDYTTLEFTGVLVIVPFLSETDFLFLEMFCDLDLTKKSGLGAVCSVVVKLFAVCCEESTK